jgi:FkbM family methyltransferase
MTKSEHWLRDATRQLVISKFPPSVAFPLRFQLVYRRDPYLFDLMRVLMDPARDTVDVGAHKGLYSWFFTRFSRRVFSFEPNPENFRVLSRLGRRATCYQIALSDEAKEAEFHIPCGDPRSIPDERGSLIGETGEQTRTVQVKCMPLDAFELRDVGFLKIDAEGAESQVLRGALQTIAMSKPKMMVEIAGYLIGEERLRSLIGWIENLGYDCLFFSKYRLTAFRHFDIERNQLSPQRTGDFQHFAQDFIFLPAP